MAGSSKLNRDASATGAHGAGSSRDRGELVAKLKVVRLNSGVSIWSGYLVDTDIQLILRHSSEPGMFVLHAREKPSPEEIAEARHRKKAEATQRRAACREAEANGETEARRHRRRSARDLVEVRAREIIARIGKLPEGGDELPDF